MTELNSDYSLFTDEQLAVAMEYTCRLLVNPSVEVVNKQLLVRDLGWLCLESMIRDDNENS